MPKIIEFTGLPNYGKTTLIHRLAGALPNLNYSVEVMREDAEIVPSIIPKKTWHRNMWITFGQLQSLIHAHHSNSDFVLMDRGLYDALFWASFMGKQGICSKKESEAMTKILNEIRDTYELKPDLVFLVNVSVEESVRRRMEMSGEVAVYSKNDYLDKYLAFQNAFFSKISDGTKIVSCDTTLISPDDLCKLVLDEILQAET